MYAVVFTTAGCYAKGQYVMPKDKEKPQATTGLDAGELEAEAPRQQDAQPKPKKKGRAKFFAWLVLLLVLIGAGYWVYSEYQKTQQAVYNAYQQKKMHLQGKPAVQVEPIEQPQTVQQETLQPEEQRMDVNLDTFEDRLQSLEQSAISPQQQIQHLATLLPLLHDLERAAASDQPFAEELNKVLQQVPALPTIIPGFFDLKVFATDGIATKTQLHSQFWQLRQERVKTANDSGTAPPAQGWRQHIIERFKNLVTIRHTATNSRPRKGKMHSLKQAFQNGNFDSFVQQVGELNLPPPETPISPIWVWIDQAEKRLFIDKAIQEIKLIAIVIAQHSQSGRNPS